MLFYHYSTQRFNQLISKAKQNNEIVDEPLNYANHVSLFIEPLPIIVAHIFENTHKFYRSGLELYEHVIDSNALPIQVPFYITETPEKTELLYEKQKWEEGMSKALITEYKKQIDDMEKQKGYKGVGRNNLVQTAKKVPRGIKNYFSNAYELQKKNPDDGIESKYAACVPHVMVYVGQEPIAVRSSKLITLL